MLACLHSLLSITLSALWVILVPVFQDHHPYAITIWWGGCREGSDYERVLKVNVVGSFLVTQAFYALLKKRDTRTIVNVSSGVGSITAQRAGSVPVAGKVIAYASSKAALNMRAPPRLCQDWGHSFGCRLSIW